MKQSLKIISVLLLLVVLSSCGSIESTIVSPTSEPSLEPTSESLQLSTTDSSFSYDHGGMYEEDGKYYLDLEYNPEHFEFMSNIDGGYPLYDTRFICTSIDELLEKWRTCSFTEEEMFLLAYVVWDGAGRGKNRIQIMNPNDLFYPIDDNKFWKDAQVIWDPKTDSLSFLVEDEEKYEEEEIVIKYAEKCETIEDDFVLYDNASPRFHKTVLEFLERVNLPSSADQEIVKLGDIAFSKYQEDQIDHYHCQNETPEGRTYYLCLTGKKDRTKYCFMMTLYNGYFVTGWCTNRVGYFSVDDCYETLLDPLIYTDFKDYSAANNS